jgi:membrane protease YdiL (CAAX protease family)
MLSGTLDESNAAARDEPLWSIAGLVTASAFGTSVFAQWLVLLLEQSSGPSSTLQAMNTPLTLARGALIVQSALAVLVAAILRRNSVLRRRSLAGSRLSLAAFVQCLGLVLGLAPVANDLGFRLSQALHQPPDNARWVMQIVQHASRQEFLVLGLVLTLVPACIEELLFRGVLMGALSGGPFWLVLGLQAAAFGAFHVDAAQGLATFILGLGFGFMRLQTRSLWAPITAHATYNVIVLLSMRMMHPENNPPPNQGLGLVLSGILLGVVCVIGLRRNAIVQEATARPA